MLVFGSSFIRRFFIQSPDASSKSKTANIGKRFPMDEYKTLLLDEDTKQSMFSLLFFFSF